jgi:hypothetical protein
MKVIRIVLIFIYVLVMQAVVCLAEQDKVDLKLRLKSGESHEMKMTQVQDINQTINGQPIKIKQTQEMVMSLDVVKAEANGVMDMAVTYKSVKMGMDGPMGHMEFDSTNPKPADPNKPQEKMMAAIYSAIVGCKFQMKVKPTGETFDVRGTKEMLGKVREKIGNNPETPGMDEFLDKMFDEKQLKELCGNMMGMFPAEPVAIGDTWYDTISMNFMMPIDISTTYMLKERKNGIAFIDAVAKMDMGDSSKAIELDPNNKMSMQISGTMNSANQVDEKTGLLRKGNTTMNFSGIVKMEPEPNQPGQPMTMPMTIVGNVVVELIK